jgi:FkbM family methyltransferase
MEDGQTIDLETKDGLILSIRQNHMDAAILGEVFLDNCYIRGFQLPDLPIVVDIGGYIGDFAIYAVKRLNASRVVVCEPSPRNWSLLKRNVANNRYEDRITAINKAVTTGEDVFMNVDAPDRNQATISAYGPSVSGRTRVPGISLASLIESQGLRHVDLLKIDCEGGEYDILLKTPSEVFKSVQKIAFESHEIDGFQAKLEAVKERLRSEGYIVAVRSSLVYASRP